MAAPQVTIPDVIDFFVAHMQNDNLGQIANAHKCWFEEAVVEGRRLPPAQWGACSRECLELANMHHQGEGCVRKDSHDDCKCTRVPLAIPAALGSWRHTLWSSGSATLGRVQFSSAEFHVCGQVQPLDVALRGVLSR
jgi:hypothetical protein